MTASLTPAQVQEMEKLWPVDRYRTHYEQCWKDHYTCAIARLIASHRELEKENFALAAGQCCVPGGMLSGDGGSPYCIKEQQLLRLQDEYAEKLEASQKFTDTLIEKKNKLQAEATRLREQLNDAVCYILHGGQRPNLVDIQQALTGQEGEG